MPEPVPSPERLTAEAAAALIAVPGEADDKYSRGVLGVVTGSARYPGAAVLGVDAATRTGVGMVRYVGPDRARDLVLARRPETVTGAGRVQAWLIGSGMSPDDRDDAAAAALRHAVDDTVPLIVDAGALDLVGPRAAPTIITPHAGELARMLGADRGDVAADPRGWARRAHELFGVTVLLKGHTTHLAGPGVELTASEAPSWAAVAGSGDALGGVLGALVATHADEVATDPAALARLGAAAAVIHGLAATRASAGGPFTVSALVEALPATVAALLAGRAR